MAITGIDNSYLLGLYTGTNSNASNPLEALAGTTTSTSTPAVKYAPTAPWKKDPTPAEITATVKAALAGRKFIDENAAQLDLKGASSDYKKLFALYQGLGTLSDLASRAQAKGLTGVELGQLQKAFARGMDEVSAYVSAAKLEQSRLSQGEAASSVKSKLSIAKAKTEYVTAPLTSSTSDPVPAFEGPVSFTISVKQVNTVHDVAIDLSGMGGQPRTIGNVINYINDQLQAEGLETRIQSQRIPGAPRTTTVGGKTVTLTPSADQWALKVKVGTSETVAFSAPQTAGAVYVAQQVGNPDPDGKSTTSDSRVEQQFLKFQTDTDAVAAPLQGAGEAHWAEGRLFSKTLGPEVKTVHAQTVGPDGSVYMLADVTKAIDGQDIKGTQDVALLKYDSSGKLVYTRTLGAAGSATGLALAVSADGKIAVAGAVTGDLSGATEGALNSNGGATYAKNSDSFVTLYDPEGQELWTQRRGARQDDEASEVAFGADGAVYVAGRAKSAMQGAEAIGDWDSYVQAFRQDATTGTVKTLFTQSFGTAGSDRPAGLVVDGTSIVTASVEQGHAVLRRFDVSGAAPVLTASRDLGDLQGGDIAGLSMDGGKIVVAGTTANGNLSAGAVTRGYSGGTDAFAASMSADLTAAPTDRLAYYGGAGDDRATSLAVAGGKVWIGGSAGTDLPNQDDTTTKDGFLANLDLDTGTIGWSRRIVGKDGLAAPTAIAVAPTGASVLDRIGLPTGTLDLTGSERLTAVSSLRAGEKFTVKVGTGRAATVTIDDKDTLDTLAQKIRRASGFQAKVTVATAQGVRTLKIEPISPRQVMEIGPGTADKDALDMLGISESVVRVTTQIDGKEMPADLKAKIYGLGLPRDLNLSNKDQVAHALAEVVAAQGVVRSVYKDMVAAVTPKSAASQIAAQGGKAPAYLTNQIANYQAALDRLTGGSG